MFQDYLEAIAKLHGAAEIEFSESALASLTPHLRDEDRGKILEKVEVGDRPAIELTLEVPPVFMAGHHHRIFVTNKAIRYGKHYSEWTPNDATTFSREHWEKYLFSQFSLPHLLKVELVPPYSRRRPEPLVVGYLVLREPWANIEFQARGDDRYLRTVLGEHIEREVLTPIELLELESILSPGTEGQEFCVNCGFHLQHCNCLGMTNNVPKAQRIGLPIHVLNRWRAPFLDADGYLSVH